MKYLVSLVLILLLAAGGAWLVAGRMPGPSVQIVQPEKWVGLSTPMEAVVQGPAAELSALTFFFFNYW